MIDDTENEKIDAFLKTVEGTLAEPIGRYATQGSIGLFAELASLSTRKRRNVWVELFELGRALGRTEKDV